MASKIMEESRVDNKIIVIEIISELVSPKNKKIQIEAIITEAMIRGLSEDTVNAAIEELENDHIIEYSDTGYVKLL